MSGAPAKIIAQFEYEGTLYPVIQMWVDGRTQTQDIASARAVVFLYELNGNWIAQDADPDFGVLRRLH